MENNTTITLDDKDYEVFYEITEEVGTIDEYGRKEIIQDVTITQVIDLENNKDITATLSNIELDKFYNKI
jgi:hypothetical protein